MSKMVMAPRRTSGTAGVKVTVKVQVAPAASVAGNVPHGFGVVSAKSPLSVMVEMISGAPPVFLSVAVWDALVTPTG